MINGWWGCGVLHWWVRRSSCWEAPDGKKLIAPTLITPVQPRLPGHFNREKFFLRKIAANYCGGKSHNSQERQITAAAKNVLRFGRFQSLWGSSLGQWVTHGLLPHLHTPATPCFDMGSTRLLPEVRNGCLRNLILQSYARPPYCGLTTNCVFFNLSQMIISPNSPAPPSLLLYYRAPHDHLYSPIPQRFSSRDTQASHASLSFVQCLPHPPSLMAT